VIFPGGRIKAAVLRADNLANFICALRACSDLYRDFFTFNFSFIYEILNYPNLP
jgi:hypothetical protein